jgi:AcrR family transcriptional regulator
MASATARQSLIEAAMRRLEEGGPDAVSARKVTAEIGVSTTAVYTYFGGLPELFDAVALEGDMWFGASLSDTPVTENPMTDLFVQGMAYREWALRNPQLYRLIFGLTRVFRPGPERTTGDRSMPRNEKSPFAVLLRTIERVQAAGQIGDVDTVAATGQFLCAIHGFVLLEPTGLFEAEGKGLDEVFRPLGMSVMIGLGASGRDVQSAATAAVAARSATA